MGLAKAAHINCIERAHISMKQTTGKQYRASKLCNARAIITNTN